MLHSYIHGIMYGELMQDFELENEELQEFCIV
jgi:hypothetical protein